MNDADHAVLRIDDRQRVQIVFVEDLRQFVLAHFGWAGQNAWFGKYRETRVRLRHHQAGERNGSSENPLLIEEVDLRHALGVAVEVAQGLHGVGDSRVHIHGDEVSRHGAGSGSLVELK